MLKVNGQIEVFQNKRGYITGVIKSWGENKDVLGKAYIDVNLPESVLILDGQTLTLDVKTAYLNAVHIEGKNEFTKLVLNIVDADIVKIFPDEKEVKKTSKKVSK